MTSNPEQRNRVLGFNVGPGRRRGRGEYEEQHVLGFPAGWFDNVNVDALRWLVHPVQEYRRRRLAPDTSGEDKR